MVEIFYNNLSLAESRRFELLVDCSTHAFQACALDHYANSPTKKSLSWLLYLYLVTPRRVELRFTGWKPAVLTVRRWGRIWSGRQDSNRRNAWIAFRVGMVRAIHTNANNSFPTNLNCEMVGKTGLEPATPASQTRCASQLRHFPTYNKMVGMPGFEPGTSSLSETRSNQLSYTPITFVRWL